MSETATPHVALLTALAAELAPLVRDRLEKEGPVRARLLSVKDAAVYLGRSEDSVRYLLGSGTLKRVKWDRRVLIDRKDLDTLIETSKE